MHSLYDINLFYASALLGYFIIFLVGVALKGCKIITSLSLTFFIVFSAQTYFSTYSLLFESVTEMWKYYCVMFLLDGLLFLYLSIKPSKKVFPYLIAICCMSFLSFVLMFEAYFTIETTFIYYLYEIAIPTIHTYLLACLIIGVGGVKGIRNNNDTGGASDSKTSENSFGGLP